MQPIACDFLQLYVMSMTTICVFIPHDNEQTSLPMIEVIIVWKFCLLFIWKDVMALIGV